MYKCFDTKKNIFPVPCKHELLNGGNHLLNGRFWAVNGVKEQFFGKKGLFLLTAYSTVISSINTQESPPAPKCHTGNLP